MLAIILSIVALLVLVIPFLIFECSMCKKEEKKQTIQYTYKTGTRKEPNISGSENGFEDNVDEISVNAEYHTMTKNKKPSSMASESKMDDSP